MSRVNHAAGASRVAGLGLCLALLVPVPSVAQELTVLAIVEEGDPAPGTEDVFQFFETPVVNAAGTVVFVGTVAGTRGLWRSDAGALEQVASAEGTPVGSPGSIDFVRGILLSGKDPIVVRAALSTGADGYFAVQNGALVPIAIEGQPAPGTDGVFASLGESLRVSNAGEVAFLGELEIGVGSTDTSNFQGIWSGGAGTLGLVARQGDPAPGGPGDTFLTLDPFPRISPSGLVAFGSALFGPNGLGGVWTGTPGSLTAALLTADQYWNVVLSDIDELAFVQFSGGEPLASIEEGTPGDLRTVIDSDDQAPGLPPGATIDFNFAVKPELRMNRFRRVAFRALAFEGAPGQGRQGLWSEVSGSLELVALQGDPVPGAPSLVYVETGGFETNDRGGLAFFAEIGSSPDFPGDLALLLANRSQEPVLVAREGGPFQLAPGDVRTVQSIRWTLESEVPLDESEHGGLDDAGRLFFALEFTDGHSGVYVAQLPEPGASGLALAALATVAWLSRARRRSATTDLRRCGRPCR